MSDTFSPASANIVLHFPDALMAEQFKGWLSDGGGEQAFALACYEAAMQTVAFDYHQRSYIPVRYAGEK